MTAHFTEPTLRLVNTEGDSPLRLSTPGNMRIVSGRPLKPHERAAERVAAENAAASGMSALDPRWIVAVQTFRDLDGGRAAVLTPEKRRRLVCTGKRLGLRAFDTNLIIAIVQDGARSGSDPLGYEVVGRLEMLRREPDSGSARAVTVGWMILAAAVSSVATAMLMRIMGA